MSVLPSRSALCNLCRWSRSIPILMYGIFLLKIEFFVVYMVCYVGCVCMYVGNVCCSNIGRGAGLCSACPREDLPQAADVAECLSESHFPHRRTQPQIIQVSRLQWYKFYNTLWGLCIVISDALYWFLSHHIVSISAFYLQLPSFGKAWLKL